ncbi:GntR family transcriptional regulator [Streptococcus danieliae]|uniref:GntR family transcriptional regulator n=1 Tax=Streptococcus danieliae TaxID=747656 RepID=A0A7Z0S5G7_9STRE|nr:GntR family transcriptional regulator [Streptococcus danieliae]MBF0698543.1 GntR family transcriptional regulator [Streptococcus danieliae]NYS95720.1 GntR family transcriptional regulator [Streptococcus danieliae]
MKKNLSMPLHTQLTDQLMELIREMGSHEKLSSERELCQQFHVSRTTVRKSLAELEDLGYIYRKHGQGTFVSGLWKRKQNLLDSYNYNQQMLNLGKVPSHQIEYFGLVQAHKKVADCLHIKEQDLVYKIKRLRLADDEAMMFETTYLPAQLFPKLTQEQIQEKGLYKTLEQEYGQQIIYADELFSAGQIGENVAEYLKQPISTPCLNIRRETYNQDRKIIELTFTTARSDQFSYKVRHFNTYLE